MSVSDIIKPGQLLPFWLCYFRGIFSPCIEFNGTKAWIVYRKNLMIYHLISQNGKHVPKTAPTFSRLAPFVRAGLHYKAISAQKRDTCGKTGRESKYKHDVNTFFRGGGQGCKNICSLKYDKTREGKLRMKNVHISPPTGYMSVDVIRRSALGSN